MSATLSKYALKLLAYVWPYILAAAKEWAGTAWIDFMAKRAKKKATKEAEEKYDAVINNPASTVEERANAAFDLINHPVS